MKVIIFVLALSAMLIPSAVARADIGPCNNCRFAAPNPGQVNFGRKMDNKDLSVGPISAVFKSGKTPAYAAKLMHPAKGLYVLVALERVNSNSTELVSSEKVYMPYGYTQIMGPLFVPVLSDGLYRVTVRDMGDHKVPLAQGQFAMVNPNKVGTSVLSPLLGWSVTRWTSEIVWAANQTGTRPKVLAAIMKVESNGYMHNQWGGILTSPAGALGLMQLEPATAAGFGVNPYKTWQNVLGGARALKWFLNYFGGNQYLAVAAYNAGQGNVAAGYGYADKVYQWIL